VNEKAYDNLDDIVAAKFTELEAKINMPTIVNILSTMSTKIVEHQEEFVRLSKDVVTCQRRFFYLAGDGLEGCSVVPQRCVQQAE